jgi:hypothetical protein
MVCPFLKEIWVALRNSKYFAKRAFCELAAFSSRWSLESILRVNGGESAHSWEIEQPLRVRLRFPGKANKLGQSSP